MIALACKEALITEEISIAVCEEVEIDLDTVARFKVAPFETLRTDLACCSQDGGGLPWEAGEISVADEGRTPRSVRGFLLYKTVGAAVAYLGGRYAAAGSSRLDVLVREMRKERRFRAYRQIEDALLRSGAGGGGRGRRGGGLPLVRREEFLKRTVLMETAGGAYFFVDAIDSPSVAIAVRDRQAVSGDVVERTQLVAARDLDETDPKGTWAVWAFDGVRAHCARSVWDLPAAFLERMERHGRLYALGNIDPFPRVAARPVAILRVPSRRQWRAYTALCTPTPKERLRELLACRMPEALDRPLLVYDSRLPVALPEGLPVISDLGAICAVLSRACEGVCVPGDLACYINEEDLPENGGHLIACVPEVRL